MLSALSIHKPVATCVAAQHSSLPSWARLQYSKLVCLVSHFALPKTRASYNQPVTFTPRLIPANFHHTHVSEPTSTNPYRLTTHKFPPPAAFTSELLHHIPAVAICLMPHLIILQYHTISYLNTSCLVASCHILSSSRLPHVCHNLLYIMSHLAPAVCLKPTIICTLQYHIISSTAAACMIHHHNLAPGVRLMHTISCHISALCCITSSFIIHV